MKIKKYICAASSNQVFPCSVSLASSLKLSGIRHQQLPNSQTAISIDRA